MVMIITRKIANAISYQMATKYTQKAANDFFSENFYDAASEWTETEPQFGIN